MPNSGRSEDNNGPTIFCRIKRHGPKFPDVALVGPFWGRSTVAAAKRLGDRRTWVDAGVDAWRKLGCISIACRSDNSSQTAGLLPLQFGHISSRVGGAPIRAEGGRDVCSLS
jgi:hypothetical protein